ncbi:MAG: Rpn family recombination-promoting nuclease/putative transposase [Cyanobacteria bacterium J06614_10]
MYDPVCKFLVENFSADFASWLLGESVELATLNPSELSLEPIRADSVLLLESAQSAQQPTILHIEFQTQPNPDILFRMLDYWVRIYRLHSSKSIRQVVIYLRRTGSNLVYQTRFQKGGTSHPFEVVRLWEQPFEAFLSSPGLLPFAALSRVSDPAGALRQVATQIRETLAPEEQQRIAASTAVLAGLILEDQSLIRRIIGMDLLEQSSVYQGIKQEGRLEGRLEGECALVLRLLSRKLGDISPVADSQIRGLSVAQLENLGEALLDFSKMADLERWLSEQA